MKKTSAEKIALIHKYVIDGLSAKEVAKLVQCSKRTVTACRSLMNEKCACGRNIAHRGRCWFRMKSHQQQAIAINQQRAITAEKQQMIAVKYDNISAPQLHHKIQKPESSKGFSLFDGLPKVTPRRNKPWRRMDF